MSVTGIALRILQHCCNLATYTCASQRPQLQMCSASHIGDLSNCVVYKTADVMETLLDAIQNNAVPHTEGNHA